MSEDLQERQQLPTPPSYPPPTANSIVSSPEQGKNKRARPTISCLECRRKKLKCDRVQPCMQCTKSGKPAMCQFAAASPLKSSAGVALSEEERKRKRHDGDVDVSSSINGAIGMGGKPLSGTLWWDSVTSPGKPNDKPEAPKTSSGRIFVKGDRSRYLGLSDRMAILDHFEDARSFITTSFHTPDMADMMAELSAIQKMFHSRKSLRNLQTPPVCPSLGRPGLVSAMMNSFPLAEVVRLSTSRYSVYYESLIRIVNLNDLASSTSNCELWREKANGIYSLPPDAKEGKLAQILSIIALAGRLTNRSVSAADQISEEQISKWTELSQRWVDDQKGKERLNIDGLRAQVLLLLLYQNNLMSPAELWQKSGNLVRAAMIMGLHQDPEACPGFSLFEKEQRRKLWYSIVELDIQFSLAIGMPSAIRSSDIGARDLLNVDDIDLVEDMKAYPPEKPQHQWTDAIAQIALGASLRDRLDATNMLGGSFDLERDAAAILTRASALERHLHFLPTSIRSDPIPGGNNEKSSAKLFTRIMLDVFIRRSFLALYQTIALSPLSERYPEARKAAVQSSIAILSHLDALDPTVADLNTIKDRDLLNHFHILCKNDIIQAATMLCVEIRRFSLQSADTNSEQKIQHDVPWTKHSLTRIVENTLNSLIQRLGEFGSDLKDILPLSIVLQCARSDGNPEGRRELMRNGAERILNACRKAVSDFPQPAPPAVETFHQNTNLPQILPGPPLPFYWTPTSNPNVVARSKQANDGPTQWGDRNLIGVDIDFQDFDFGFEDWGMDQAWV